MKVAIGSDHAGFHLKGTLLAWLVDNGYEVDDLGTAGLRGQLGGGGDVDGTPPPNPLPRGEGGWMCARLPR